MGLTEPDPRDDLSGQDVGRKLLILARQMGSQLDIQDVRVDSLVGVNDAAMQRRLERARPAAQRRTRETGTNAAETSCVSRVGIQSSWVVETKPLQRRFMEATREPAFPSPTPRTKGRR